jgi:large subunit ribosomal protein L32
LTAFKLRNLVSYRNLAFVTREDTMPTPKKKTSRSVRNMRRSHDGIEAPGVAVDKKTGDLIRPHRANKGADGAYYYKGKQISAATK